MSRGKLAELIKKNETLYQVLLFTLFGFYAFFSQAVSRIICDIAFRDLSQVVVIAPFPAQALGSFLAFLISNIVAKVVSYVFNRKKTFNANNSPIFSTVSYTVLVVLLIVVETVIGTPMQNGLYSLFGGTYIGAELTTASAESASLYQISGTAAQIIYGAVDSVIVFILDKFVIMRHIQKG